MKTRQYPDRSDWSDLCTRPAFDSAKLEVDVLKILSTAKEQGDVALIDFNKKFDGVETEEIKLDISEMTFIIDSELAAAIKIARDNISKFHSAQQEDETKIETTKGVSCWRKSVPIQNVGLYIPGGSAPLFSTLLMLAIPAKIAGCENIVVCTPPQKTNPNEESNTGINQVIGWTCQLLGINEVFLTGGAQAIGAMAYGTASIPKVDKIFGPGNQYVTAAKQLVQKDGVAIDMPAGPSEVLVIADDSASPEFLAADLLSQAEHGPDSQVVLISNSDVLIQNVEAELTIQIESLPRKEIALQALENSQSILVNNLDEAIDFSNVYAPEHLIVATRNCDELVDKIVNAGSVFLGNWSCESAGDYASGTNHTLPTSGYARNYSGVSVDSFIKKITFQKISEKGIRELGPSIEKMADAEKLWGHKNAVTVRLEKMRNEIPPLEGVRGRKVEKNHFYNKNLKEKARKLRNESTLAEGTLWKYVLRASGLGYPFKRQRPIGRYIVDFVSMPLKLIVEVDGITHSYEEVSEKDESRQNELEELGFRMIRIPDDAILSNVDRVRNYLLEEIDNLPLNPSQKGETKNENNV